MSECFSPRFRWLALSLVLALRLSAADKPIHPTPVVPGPADGRIAFVTASMLEQLHYLKQPFDQTVSAKFFEHYLEEYDPQHLHFLQSDLDEFDHYRTNLNLLTKSSTGSADARPACEIFNRFMERLEQRIQYADDLLKSEKFTFNDNDRITINRHDLPYPKDLAQAKALWRERLRFEYLQERLGKKNTSTNVVASSVKADSEPGASGVKPVDGGPTALSKPVKTEAEEISETLARRYHRTFRAYAELNNDDILQRYLTTLARIYDPHSDYFGRAAVESFSITMNLSLFGIGAELASEDGYCTIRRLLPEGPAEKSKKIKVKDRIVAVAQGDQPPVDVVEMTINKAVQLIRGPKGTEVRLTVIPADGDASKQTVVTLIRDEIKLEDQAAKAKIIEVPDAPQPNLRLGVIDLPSFYAPFPLGPGAGEPPVPPDAVGKWTSADVAHLLKKMKEEKVGGVILDLRRNGGGSLEEAIRLTGLFIKQGPVVQVRSRDGRIEENDDLDPSVAYDGPLIVLTSRFSASASEIVAGALQDYGRALIVGDSSTHGKGTVQSVNQLRPFVRLPEALMTNDPGALKVTIKKFYRAGGASTQLKGVVPDIILPSILNESKDIGESALDSALAYDFITNATFTALNLVQPYLPELRTRSTQRVAADPEYAYVREDIELFKKQQADKTISLNEKERLKEKEEGEARQKARDKSRLARKPPLEVVHELKLRDADLPGLPPVVARTNATVAKIDAKSATTEDADEEKPAPVDVSLAEAEHILVDYLSLLSKADVVAGRAPSGATRPE